MDKKQKILELRERLDKTLGMPDLVNEESIKSLVKDQLLCSSLRGNEAHNHEANHESRCFLCTGNLGNVVEKRTIDVSNFLHMLRSASGKDQRQVEVNDTVYNEWKIKQDSDQLRVMYREGPHGTPFHTLLAEGFADGPLDVCICVAWETTLYKKWWPQYNIPTFKITTATSIQKVCVGEEISLIRMKVPWPISDREFLLHYFAIEYYQEDLILVLLNTITDEEHIDVNTHGFTREGIPEAKVAVRIDLVGGFVFQKVDSKRSYFRLIANMDVKLDFVPSTLINFMSRQLLGNGHKLFQKAVRQATSDKDYRQALQGSLYARIREGRDSDPVLAATEIVEEETEHNFTGSSMNQIISTEEVASNEDVILSTEKIVSRANAFVSPQVQRALKTVDQAIAVLRRQAK